MPLERRYSPPEIAKAWRISPDKVVTWIKSGELEAIDANTKRGGKPRYLVAESALNAFE